MDTTTDTTPDGSADRARPALTDAEVVRRVLAGDTAAFEAVMRRYNQRLYRIARGIAGNDADAQDILQDAYVRAYLRLSQFRGPAGFASWLSRIVVNEALGRARKRGLGIDNARTTDDLPTATRHSPEEIAMGDDTRALIEAAVDALPPDFRVVFMLRAVEGLGVEETAELLGIRPATVKTRLFRAKSQMRRSLARRIEDTVPASFTFAGTRCDSIVNDVFAAIAGIVPGRQ